MNQPNTMPASPYPGLRPFEREEADLFFGRETQINEMLARLEEHPDFKFLAVLGASGSGKSSLIRAGLIPALDRGFLIPARGSDSREFPSQWRFVIARPGEAPLRNLAEAWVETWHPLSKSPTTEEHERRAVDVNFTLAQLRGGPLGIVRAYRGNAATKDRACLILIDQFEELFRFRREQKATSSASGTDGVAESGETAANSAAEREKQRNEAAAFVELLLMTATQSDLTIYVAITMRSDFLGDCDAFVGLPEAVSRSQYLTPRMTRAQLSEAIVRPTAIPEFHTSIKPDLITRILNDVGTNRDQLPLMQHALMRTWQHALGKIECDVCQKQSNAKVVDIAPIFDSSTSKRELTIDDYTHIGDVSGALDKHSNAIFDSLAYDSTRKNLQRVTERLFCSLCERRDGGPLVRRPITVKQAALEIGSDYLDEAELPSDRAAERNGRVEQDVMTVAREFAAANLLTFSPPVNPEDLNLDTKLDISHESLFRQWDKLREWIRAETKSALIYRGLFETFRRGESDLGDVQLAQAKEWLTNAQPNAHWAMRYDGTEQSACSTFQSCCSLIESSEQARRDRLSKEQRLQNLKYAAAVLVALIPLVLYKLYQENVARRDADESRMAATEGLKLQLKMFTEPTRLCGRIAAAATADSTDESRMKKVGDLLNELEFSSRPFAHTGQIQNGIKKLREQAKAWNGRKSESESFKRGVLSLARLYRIAWEEPFRELPDDAKRATRQLLVKDASQRASDVIQRLSEQPTNAESRAEFESLYWGELVLLEYPDVEGEMVRFRNALNGDRTDFQRFADKLKEAGKAALDSKTGAFPKWLEREYQKHDSSNP